MQSIHSKSFNLYIYCEFYKDILHFLNQDTALKNKIINKMADFNLVPRGTVYVTHHL